MSAALSAAVLRTWPQTSPSSLSIDFVLADCEAAAPGRPTDRSWPDLLVGDTALSKVNAIRRAGSERGQRRPLFVGRQLGIDGQHLCRRLRVVVHVPGPSEPHRAAPDRPATAAASLPTCGSFAAKQRFERIAPRIRHPRLATHTSFAAIPSPPHRQTSRPAPSPPICTALSMLDELAINRRPLGWRLHSPLTCQSAVRMPRRIASCSSASVGCSQRSRPSTARPAFESRLPIRRSMNSRTSGIVLPHDRRKRQRPLRIDLRQRLGRVPVHERQVVVLASSACSRKALQTSPTAASTGTRCIAEAKYSRTTGDGSLLAIAANCGSRLGQVRLRRDRATS